MSSSGQVLVTCLREVERAYPFFLCMLGERYGWHDMSDITNMRDETLELTFQRAIDAGYSWVANFKDRSITELEIIHGALRFIPSSRMQTFGEPVDFGYRVSDEVKERELKRLNSFFYLRDPSFIDNIKSDQKPIYAAENFLAKHKTAELRETIRSTELPWRGYRDLAAFELHAMEDLLAAIGRQFCGQAEPDPFELENMRHIAVARAHLANHSPRQSLLKAIHRHVNSSSRIEAPLVLSGERSGVGLTAVMAYASAYYANLNPDKLVIFHFARASDKSTLYFEFMRRAIDAIRKFFKLEQPTPADKDEIVADFPGWLHMAAERGGALIFIDGLDQMDDVDGAHQLDWLPSRLPLNVRVILSSSSSLNVLRQASGRWAEQIPVGLLSKEETVSMLDLCLSSRSKTLSPGQRHKIVASEACRLPLYLKALLDELTVEGVFETLSETIDSYLEAKDPHQLYERIVRRWSRDFGAAFVTAALALIKVARQGISEYELLDILKCSHSDWNRLYMPLRDSLINRNGLLCFSNQLIGDVVVSNRSIEKDTRTRIAKYFWSQQQRTPFTQELSSRTVAELPHQLRQLRNWEWLFMCLTDIRMFSALYTDEFMYELIAYWREIEEAHQTSPLQLSKMDPNFASLGEYIRTSDGDVVIASLRLAMTHYSASAPSERNLANKFFKYGEFTREVAKYSASSEFYLQSIQLQESLVAAIDDRSAALNDLNGDGQSVIEELALSYDGMAFLLKTISKYSDAASYSGKAIDVLNLLPLSKSVAYSFISALCNYSQILGKQVKLDESEAVARRAVSIAKGHLPPYDPEVARAVNCLSIALKKLKRFADAEPLALESLQLREKVCGPNHTFVSYSLMNVGNIYAKLKRFNEAVSAYERMYRITCDFHGANHPQGAQAKYSLGKLYLKIGHRSQAEINLNAALKIALEVYGDNHAFTRKIFMKILDMVGYEGSEKQLLASIQATVGQVVHFGISTRTLLRTEHGVLIPARTDRKQDEAASLGIIRDNKPQIELYPPNYFARLAALEDAKVAARNRTVIVEEPFESSDEEMKEEAAFESSDEDMGFSLFD